MLAIVNFINDPVHASRITSVANDKENITNLLNKLVDVIVIDELTTDT